MATVMRCEPCGKNFTGPACYNQHLASEKHKRKLLSFGLLNDSNKRDVQSAGTVTQNTQLSLFECSVCKAAFDTFINFQIHSESPEHAQKVIEKNSGITSTFSDVSSSSGTLNCESNTSNLSIFDDEHDKILPVNDMLKSQVLSFSICSTCNKHFSGPEPYKQHMESVTHQKKVEMERNALSAITPTVAAFSCDPCNKVFSGSVPYLQHMNSEIHRKKLVNLQLTEKGTSEVVASGSKEPRLEDNYLENKSQNIQWFCYTCKVQCTGLIPYEQHLAGILHLKNVNKAQIEKSFFKAEDSIQLASKNSTENKILNASHFINGTNEQLSNNNGNMNTDAVIPGLMNHLKVMSSEELEKSIKIFLPNENINFDKYDNEMNTDSAEEKIPNVSEEIQNDIHEPRINQDCYESKACVTLEDVQMDEIEEKSGVHSVCDLCNVNLISKEAAQSHFDSLEHYKRKWESV